MKGEKINKKIQNVGVVTGTRAEYGILKPLLLKIQEDEQLKLSLIVSGMHFLNEFGDTYKEIKKDGFSNFYKVKMYGSKESDKIYFHGFSLGNGISEFTKVLSKMKLDILLVFGDRLEAFAAACAAATLNIPLGHIHAGDKTDSGHIDEQLRFCISRFSHILFAPTDKCKKRLIETCEQKFRVFNTGALGLDSVLKTDIIPEKKLEKNFKIDFKKPVAVVVFHPNILEHHNSGRDMEKILISLKELDVQSIVIYPNNDIGSKKIINVIEKYSKDSFTRVFKNLDHDLFINLMQKASFMIGNSSSGVIEAPLLGLPVINVGIRNTGREHGCNVLYIKPKKEKIKSAVNKVLNDKKFLNEVKKCKNPYGTGNTSEKIVKILKKIDIDDKLLKKNINC